ARRPADCSPRRGPPRGGPPPPTRPPPPPIQYRGVSPHGERWVNVVYDWIASGNIGAEVAFQLDPLSIVMLMVVTWVGFLIHVYSVGYMHDDEGYWRYFAYLNFFLSEMLVLILGS